VLDSPSSKLLPVGFHSQLPTAFGLTAASLNAQVSSQVAFGSGLDSRAWLAALPMRDDIRVREFSRVDGAGSIRDAGPVRPAFFALGSELAGMHCHRAQVRSQVRQHIFFSSTPAFVFRATQGCRWQISGPNGKAQLK
jgi:hypothetical protein